MRSTRERLGTLERLADEALECGARRRRRLAPGDGRVRARRSPPAAPPSCASGVDDAVELLERTHNALRRGNMLASAAFAALCPAATPTRSTSSLGRRRPRATSTLRSRGCCYAAMPVSRRCSPATRKRPSRRSARSSSSPRARRADRSRPRPLAVSPPVAAVRGRARARGLLFGAAGAALRQASDPVDERLLASFFEPARGAAAPKPGTRPPARGAATSFQDDCPTPSRRPSAVARRPGRVLLLASRQIPHGGGTNVGETGPDGAGDRRDGGRVAAPAATAKTKVVVAGGPPPKASQAGWLKFPAELDLNGFFRKTVTIHAGDSVSGSGASASCTP